MKRHAPTRSPAELEPIELLDPIGEETDAKTDDDEVYSDEFLDEFMQADLSEGNGDGDDYGYAIGNSSMLDGDDDFDSYFRDADGYSQSQRPRRQRTKSRHARESFEFETFDRSDWRAHNQRRPRR